MGGNVIVAHEISCQGNQMVQYINGACAYVLMIFQPRISHMQGLNADRGKEIPHNLYFCRKE